MTVSHLSMFTSSPEQTDSSTSFLQFVLSHLFLSLGVRGVGGTPCSSPGAGHPWVHLDSSMSSGGLHTDFSIHNIIGHYYSHDYFSFQVLFHLAETSIPTIGRGW